MLGEMMKIFSRLQLFGYMIPFFALIGLFYIWSSTNPSSVGPGGILVVFMLLYIFWVSVFFGLLHFGHALLVKFDLLYKVVMRRGQSKYRSLRAYYIASILAFAPVLLLAMQSVNQLTARDILLVFLFVSLAIFYVMKRS